MEINEQSIIKVSEKIKRCEEEIGKGIIGQKDTIRNVLIAIFAEGNVLLEGMPGMGKTQLVKTISKVLNLDFSRIQFTPDLMPADVVGTNIVVKENDSTVFKFEKGPVFTNLLLADEINRATPKTQSALLECMEERQVTVDGKTRPLPAPFIVIATQNPVETTGTFPLPEAQLDRFFMKLSMGLPSKEEELSILTRFEHAQPLAELSAVCTTEEIVAAQKDYKKVFVHPLLLDYMTELSQQSRRHPYVVTGVSPRGTLALLNASKAYAFLHERSFVVPEDIKAVAVFVLAHRLVLSRGVGSQSTGTEIIEKLLSDVAVPTENWGKHE